MDNPSRPRNAAATRDAILASARQAFARSGYDGAGVREIAAGAGVTAMLVNRYFGSKEALFAEVVADTMADPVILTPERLRSPDFARDFATALVGTTEPGAMPLDGFLILFRSASSPQVAKIARDRIEAMHQHNLSTALSGPDAEARSAILLSLVAGFQMMRQMLALTALADTDRNTLVRLLTPTISAILAGSFSPASEAPGHS
jgi:AcrR family transcriptional regulator